MTQEDQRRQQINDIQGGVEVTDEVMRTFSERVYAIFEQHGDSLTAEETQQLVMAQLDQLIGATFGRTRTEATNTLINKTIQTEMMAAGQARYAEAAAELTSIGEPELVEMLWQMAAEEYVEEKIENMYHWLLRGNQTPLTNAHALLNGPAVDQNRVARSLFVDGNRKWVNPKGYQLSDRVWLQGQQIRSKISEELTEGIAQGRSARDIAKRIQEYVDPDYAPLKYYKNGKIVRAGGGRPNAASAARRLARTEISHASGMAHIQAAADIPFGVLGIRWRLSGSHPEQDPCDINATQDLYGLGPGVYPIDKVPRYPNHPNDLCTLVTVHKDRESTRRDIVNAARERAGVPPLDDDFKLPSRPIKPNEVTKFPGTRVAKRKPSFGPLDLVDAPRTAPRVSDEILMQTGPATRVQKRRTSAEVQYDRELKEAQRIRKTIGQQNSQAFREWLGETVSQTGQIPIRMPVFRAIDASSPTARLDVGEVFTDTGATQARLTRSAAKNDIADSVIFEIEVPPGTSASVVDDLIVFPDGLSYQVTSVRKDGSRVVQIVDRPSPAVARATPKDVDLTPQTLRDLVEDMRSTGWITEGYADELRDFLRAVDSPMMANRLDGYYSELAIRVPDYFNANNLPATWGKKLTPFEQTKAKLKDLPHGETTFATRDEAIEWFSKAGVTFDGGRVDEAPLALLDEYARAHWNLIQAGYDPPRRIVFEPYYMDDDILGEYDYGDLGVRLNTKDWEEARAHRDTLELYKKKWHSTNDPLSTYYHEAAHHFDRQNLIAGRQTQLTLDEQRIVRRHVGRYGSTESHEAVAEIFTGVMAGQTYPDEVYEIFNKYSSFPLPTRTPARFDLRIKSEIEDLFDDAVAKGWIPKDDAILVDVLKNGDITPADFYAQLSVRYPLFMVENKLPERASELVNGWKVSRRAAPADVKRLPEYANFTDLAERRLPVRVTQENATPPWASRGEYEEFVNRGLNYGSGDGIFDDMDPLLLEHYDDLEDGRKTLEEVWEEMLRFRPTEMRMMGVIPGTTWELPETYIPALTHEQARRWFDTVGVPVEHLDDIPLNVLNDMQEAFYVLMKHGQPLPTSVKTPKIVSDSTAIATMSTDGTMTLNVFVDSVKDTILDPYKSSAEMFSVKWHASDSPLEVYFHEVGHYAHRMNDAGYSMRPRTGGLTPDEEKLIRREVSRYATTNPLEVVAEIYAGHFSGKTYSNDVMEIYKRFNGPDLPPVVLTDLRAISEKKITDFVGKLEDAGWNTSVLGQDLRMLRANTRPEIVWESMRTKFKTLGEVMPIPEHFRLIPDQLHVPFKGGSVIRKADGEEIRLTREYIDKLYAELLNETPTDEIDWLYGVFGDAIEGRLISVDDAYLEMLDRYPTFFETRGLNGALNPVAETIFATDITKQDTIDIYNAMRRRNIIPEEHEIHRLYWGNTLAPDELYQEMADAFPSFFDEIRRPKKVIASPPTPTPTLEPDPPPVRTAGTPLEKQPRVVELNDDPKPINVFDVSYERLNNIYREIYQKNLVPPAQQRALFDVLTSYHLEMDQRWAEFARIAPEYFETKKLPKTLTGARIATSPTFKRGNYVLEDLPRTRTGDFYDPAKFKLSSPYINKYVIEDWIKEIEKRNITIRSHMSWETAKEGARRLQNEEGAQLLFAMQTDYFEAKGVITRRSVKISSPTVSRSVTRLADRVKPAGINVFVPQRFEKQIFEEADWETIERIGDAVEDIRRAGGTTNFDISLNWGDGHGMNRNSAGRDIMEIDVSQADRFPDRQTYFDPDDYAGYDPLQYMILHEYGHFLHRRNTTGMNSFDFLRLGIEGPIPAEIRERVSTYAWNTNEFIAEVFAFSALGRKFDDDVMTTYHKWLGGDILNVKPWTSPNAVPPSLASELFQPRKIAQQYKDDMADFAETVERVERDMWHSYKFTGYKTINKALRSGNVGDVDPFVLEAMDRGFGRHVLDGDTKVYRGSFTEAGKPDRFEGLAVGDRIEDFGYMSTSHSRTTARKFYQPDHVNRDQIDNLYLFEITVPGGTPYIPLDGVLDMTKKANKKYVEQELVFARGSELRITGIKERDGVTTVKAELIPASAKTEFAPASSLPPEWNKVDDWDEDFATDTWLKERGDALRPKLTDAELGAIENYKQGLHESLNKALRNNWPLADKQEEIRDGLDSAFRKSLLEGNRQVFRGVQFDVARSPVAYENIRAGAKYLDEDAFISTSTEFGTALEFIVENDDTFAAMRPGVARHAMREKWLFSITLEDGQPYLPIENIGAMPLGQAEILLPRGTKFEVESYTDFISGEDQVTWVQLRAVQPKKPPVTEWTPSAPLDVAQEWAKDSYLGDQIIYRFIRPEARARSMAEGLRVNGGLKGEWIYTTDTPNFAYTGGVSNQDMLSMTTRLENPLVIDEDEFYAWERRMRDAGAKGREHELVKAAGYDSVVLQKSDGSSWILMSDPQQARIITDPPAPKNPWTYEPHQFRDAIVEAHKAGEGISMEEYFTYERLVKGNNADTAVRQLVEDHPQFAKYFPDLVSPKPDASFSFKDTPEFVDTDLVERLIRENKELQSMPEWGAWFGYKSMGARPVNDALRNNTPMWWLDAENQQRLRLETFGRFRTTEPLLVHRGLTFNPYEVPEEYALVHAGQQITDPGFMSTSANRSIATSYAGQLQNSGNIRFDIEVPQNATYIPLDGTIHGEAEMVFPPGSSLFVIDVQDLPMPEMFGTVPPPRIVKAIVLPPNTPPPGILDDPRDYATDAWARAYGLPEPVFTPVQATTYAEIDALRARYRDLLFSDDPQKVEKMEDIYYDILTEWDKIVETGGRQFDPYVFAANPTRYGDKTPWAPTMGPDDAHEFAGTGQFSDRVFYHFTYDTNVESIRRTGLQGSTGIYGDGIYLTSLPSITSTGLPEAGQDMLHVAVRVENPYRYRVYDDDRNFTPPPKVEDLRRRGYDAIIVEDPASNDGWVIVFDKENVTVVDFAAGTARVAPDESVADLVQRGLDENWYPSFVGEMFQKRLREGENPANILAELEDWKPLSSALPPGSDLRTPADADELISWVRGAFGDGHINAAERQELIAEVKLYAEDGTLDELFYSFVDQIPGFTDTVRARQAPKRVVKPKKPRVTKNPSTTDDGRLLLSVDEVNFRMKWDETTESQELFGIPEDALDDWGQYGNGWYKDLNAGMRAGDGALLENADRMTEAFKFAIPKKTTVWRGMSTTNPRLWGLDPGDTFSDAAFISTSTKREVAEGFLEAAKKQDNRVPVLLEIDLPQGTPYFPMSGFLGYDGTLGSDEFEVVLRAGTEFKVLETEILPDGTKLVRATIVKKPANAYTPPPPPRQATPIAIDEANRRIGSIDSFDGAFTVDMRAAWISYTSSGFRRLNDALRYPSPSMDDRTRDQIQHMIESFQAFTLPESTTLYRGATFGIAPDEFEELQPGDVFIDKAFLSTTPNKEIGDTYATVDGGGEDAMGYLFVIDAPAGTPYVPLQSLSDYWDENEVVLPPNSQLRVVSKTQLSATKTIVNVRFEGIEP